jgi:hypothetical protein
LINVADQSLEKSEVRMIRASVTAGTILLSLLSVASSAQPAPAEDLRRQVREVAEQVREYEKVVTKNTAAVSLVSRAWRELKDSQSAISLDRAMDFLMEAREAATGPQGQPTFATRPVERSISLVRDMKLNYEPARFPQLIETIHHESIHPLQVGAVRELTELNEFVREVQGLQLRLSSLQAVVAQRATAGDRD